MDKGEENYLRFLQGDREGLTEIVRDYKDGLILYINSVVGNIHIAEELTEETFVRLFIRRPKSKGSASFKTWLYTIGRNCAIDYLRKSKRRGELSLSEEEYAVISSEEKDPETAYIKEEEKSAVRKAMETLKPEYRQILLLVYFEGFSHREAAKIMKKTVNNIDVLVSRARAALKSQLEKEGFVYEGL
ncbi:MAG: RNA polymerase sigma factor [Firmicutes bacterium]|nr:RNA polymerase sigma factor [[Eubacterium] siraeum]MCM1488443.1 RNA polymerase sigma factor [Bacillota bacterium]